MTSSNPAGGEKSQEQSQRRSALSSLRNLLIVIFALCHGIKLLAAILPERIRPDLLPFGVAHAYEKLTGSHQNWGMFATIPSHHDYHVRIVITGTDGRERVLGPLLPGFQPYPVPEQARTYFLFERMIGEAPNQRLLLNAYFRRLDEALRAEKRIAPGESWCLEVQSDFTRHLVHIQRDGRLFQRSIQRYTPAPASSQFRVAP
ncbi:MAG TPA: hypothetical protein VD994_08785 [Prosthecobacter sp.]|nr:hypothetical protein [Prosthecobacter sp.]